MFRQPAWAVGSCSNVFGIAFYLTADCTQALYLQFVRAEDADLRVVEAEPEAHDVAHGLVHLGRVKDGLGLARGGVRAVVLLHHAVEDERVAAARHPVRHRQLGQRGLR